MKTFRCEPKAIIIVSCFQLPLTSTTKRTDKAFNGLFDLCAPIRRPSSGLKSEVLMDAGKLNFENCHVESSDSTHAHGMQCISF